MNEFNTDLKIDKSDLSQKIRRINIPPLSFALCRRLLDENPELSSIIKGSDTPAEAKDKLLKLITDWFKEGHDDAWSYAKREAIDSGLYEKLSWQEIAAIRIYDYLNNAGRVYENLNKRRRVSVNDPFTIVWLAWHHRKGGGRPDFFHDMLHLFRQFSGKERRSIPETGQVMIWMERFPAGTTEAMIKNRERNRERIIRKLAQIISKEGGKNPDYTFGEGISEDEKIEKVKEWWNDYLFHLEFAIRTPERMNDMLDYSLDTDTLDMLKKARKAGIPFFVNPYYLSLINVTNENPVTYADLTIRDYVIYSKELIAEYGRIEAWEKEDRVEPGKPNAAGWLLPNQTNIHRRYPEVAILIPDTAGRACGGLCVSCQRMYDFQRGNLNFNLDKLRPDECWEEKLESLMEYWGKDSQLRDILITGGDALMSSDRSLKVILDAVYKMAAAKREKNRTRAEGEKHAEMLRVRLGTRLPVYLPQRVTDSLTAILSEFKMRASEIGIKQFIVQTHFITPAEITPESEQAVRKLLSAGWIVTNQMVFTAAASRRGHTAKLRKDLNDIGILPYYTFTVKGYMENYRSFATNGRSVQEMNEEKRPGVMPHGVVGRLSGDIITGDSTVQSNIDSLRESMNIPFLATDRNIVNLPGIGKSQTFRVVGITRRGRRILEFEHDLHRTHSPLVDESEKLYIIESKPVKKYLEQIESMGEDPGEYESLWGYSLSVTEPRAQLFEYPEYEYTVTRQITNVGE